MIRLVVAITLVMLLSLVGFAQTPAKYEANNEPAIKLVIDRLSEAGLKKDLDTLDKLYADNYFHTNPDGSILTKKQVLDRYRTDNSIIIESNTHDEDKTVVFDDTAIFSDRVILSFKSNDKSYLKIYRVTYVLIKRAGNWQVITSHASIIS